MVQVPTRQPAVHGLEEALAEEPDEDLQKRLLLLTEQRRLAMGDGQVPSPGQHMNQDVANALFAQRVDLGQDL